MIFKFVLGLLHIYFYNRFYEKNDSGRLVNAPYVDNSYKWAGGGFLSTVLDLVKFGNVMLYSYQHDSDAANGLPKGYLSQKTMQAMLARPSGSKNEEFYYGLGWEVHAPSRKFGHGGDDPFTFHHSGGAMGCSSNLLIIPASSQSTQDHAEGIVVAIIANMQSVGLYKTSLKIAKEFENIAV